MRLEFKPDGGSSLAPSGRGLLGSVVTFILGAVLLALGVMFSMLVLAVLAVIGLLVSAYLWWKTRALRRHIREQMQDAVDQRGPWTEAGEGTVIEGEVIASEVEHDAPDEKPPR